MAYNPEAYNNFSSPILDYTRPQNYSELPMQQPVPDNNKYIGFAKFNQFISDYEGFLLKHNILIENIKIVAKFNKEVLIDKYETPFKIYQFYIIDILNEQNESIIELEGLLDKLNGININEAWAKSIIEKTKNNPIILHHIYEAGVFFEHKTYGFTYSAAAKDEVVLLNRLNDKRQKSLSRSLITEGEAMSLGLKAKKAPK